MNWIVGSISLIAEILLLMVVFVMGGYLIIILWNKYGKPPEESEPSKYVGKDGWLRQGIEDAAQKFSERYKK